MNTKRDSRTLVVSIVSHRQGVLISDLLSDLELLDFGSLALEKIIITLNVPESRYFFHKTSLPIEIKQNRFPKGFGSNHNAALCEVTADFYCVLNPDIRIPRGFEFDILADVVSLNPGVVAPAVYSKSGFIEDSARAFPSFASVLVRSVNRMLRLESNHIASTDQTPDWVAGMFMFFDRESFNYVGGFDESFFMYLEDADICRRLTLVGGKVSYAERLSVQHDARRNSLKSFDHFRWHLSSLVKFWLRGFYGKLNSGPRGRFKL